MKVFVLLAATTRLTAAATTAPAGCRKLSSDADWPVAAEWTKSLGSDVQARSKTLAPGVYHPDFNLRAESYKDVENAVKFVAKNNVRITVITTGHDYQVFSSCRLYRSYANI